MNVTNASVEPTERARLHPIVQDRPVVDFFAGALLGNGGLGAVVTVRPDAIVVHFGHNNVWDIRVAEDHAEKIGTFRDVFARVAAIPSSYARLDEDPWFREYCALMSANYAQPYPRPFPCGSLVLGWSRRSVEPLGYRLDIADGVCRVDLLVAGRPATLEIFCDQAADRLWLRYLDEHSQLAPAPFTRIRLLPDPDGLGDEGASARSLAEAAVALTVASERDHNPRLTIPESLPADLLAFRQLLPAQRQDTGNPHPDDRAFRLAVRVNAPLEQHIHPSWYGHTEAMPTLERAPATATSFVACVQLDEGLATAIDAGGGNLPTASLATYAAASTASRENWASYWGCSGVALEDDLLEQIWYRNSYLLKCAIRPGVTCPGLFANWSYRQIGTAWHGDYHMNYNVQQPFWGVFSSNRVEQHLPYVDLVERMLPLSRRWAAEYYELGGAFFPHSAYPVEMQIMPYPVPTWGWEICETPWTVQSLWWHYRYTADRTFLETRAIGPIREAVRFLVAYLTRPEAHGERWGDDSYHVFPTVVPEIYGLTPGFRANADCLVDLTLIRFVLNAYLDACDILGCEAEERQLTTQARDVLAHLPGYATAETPDGPVLVAVPGEHPDIVYNIPIPAMTVFPGEEHGLHSAPEIYELVARSYRRQLLEGGNELVFANLQGARLGLLDLERFKRQIRYCMLPNGSCADLVLQVHGRYSDATPYDFMAPMGIWFENVALTAVVNECLLQSYNGTIRLFPNWAGDRRAEFCTLRAVGAFLVSAAYEHGEVQWVEIVSEAGCRLRLLVPWPSGARCVRACGDLLIHDATLETDTTIGETIRLLKAV